MLKLALGFLAVGLLAALLGFPSIAAVFFVLAQVFAVLFLVLFPFLHRAEGSNEREARPLGALRRVIDSLVAV